MYLQCETPDPESIQISPKPIAMYWCPICEVWSVGPEIVCLKCGRELDDKRAEKE